MSNPTPILPPKPTTIANLPIATTPLGPTDLLVVEQGGVTKNVTASQAILTGQVGSIVAGANIAATQVGNVVTVSLNSPSTISVTAAGGNTARSLAAQFGDYCNVLNFGATGDGSTDDSAAINAALAYCGSTGKRLYIPRASYYCGTTGLVSPGLFQIDADFPASFNFSTSLATTALTITGPFQKIRGLTIYIPARGTMPASSVIGIDVQHRYSQLNNVTVAAFGAGSYRGFYTAIQFEEFTHSVDSCFFDGQVYGVYSNANALSIHKTTVSAIENIAIAGAGIFIFNQSAISIVGCDIEGGSSYNIAITNPNTPTGYVSGVEISGCYMEGAGVTTILVAGNSTTAFRNRGISINGNLIYAGANGAQYGVYVDYTNGIVIQGNEIVGHTTDSINIQAALGNTNGVTTGNYTDKPIVT